MLLLKISFLLCVIILCSDLCAGVFLPLLKGLKKKLIYGSYAPSYGYRTPYVAGYGYGGGYYGGYNQSPYGKYYSGAKPYYPRRHRGGRKRTGRTYSDIARVINPNPYAFVGRRPYPAQPFYPQG
ncbi:uncharacterized protein LOC111682638 [Lucilia cuprina]|uniref:uncharacterized protein LOC111682638 n=1 Tax=Lucilia cuprina TaxID=7375 RepID=UPI001F055656|nr:uncharacterized protein LOC111682638 [Lucilia cuprina]